MASHGVLLVLLVVVATLLQEEVAAAAAAEGSTTSEPSAGGEEVLLGSYSGGDTSLPLEGITLPENALSIGFESIGVFLLLAGLVGFVAYVVLGVDKTVAAVATGAYPYTGQTTYSAPGTTYSASGSAYAPGYGQEETYSVHHNIDQAAAKYQ